MLTGSFRGTQALAAHVRADAAIVNAKQASRKSVPPMKPHLASSKKIRCE